jgi:hypothetical protein
MTEPIELKTNDEMLNLTIAAFSKTIFWNNTDPWPAKNEEPFAFDVMHVGEQVMEDTLWVKADFGETRVTVAMLPAQGDDADAGNVTSEADAAFIANLPLIMPALLADARAAHAMKPVYDAATSGVGVDADTPKEIERADSWLMTADRYGRMVMADVLTMLKNERRRSAGLLAELAAVKAENERLHKVVDTLIARRDLDREIISGKAKGLPTNSWYWNDLMRRERDARVANDSAVAEYRAALAAASKKENHDAE